MKTKSFINLSVWLYVCVCVCVVGYMGELTLCHLVRWSFSVFFSFFQKKRRQSSWEWINRFLPTIFFTYTIYIQMYSINVYGFYSLVFASSSSIISHLFSMYTYDSILFFVCMMCIMDILELFNYPIQHLSLFLFIIIIIFFIVSFIIVPLCDLIDVFLTISCIFLVVVVVDVL